MIRFFANLLTGALFVATMAALVALIFLIEPLFY